MTDPVFSLKGKKVWIAGHRGMVGSAVCRRLKNENCEIITTSREQLDLTRQSETEDWLAYNKPDVVLVAAAKVGGIFANDSKPAEFIRENLAIETNIIHGAWLAGVEKLLLLGSSCIYPKMAPQPMAEENLLTGPLEPTNQWYAVAKIAGIKMCQAYRRQYGCDFISAQPTNLYGIGDNFDLTTSHVIPALIVKAHNANISGKAAMTVWGSGTPKREFMLVDDLADALVFLLQNYSGEMQINVGTGDEYTIGEVAQLVADVVGFDGDLEFDSSKPDGTPRKLIDSTRLHDMGWECKTELRDGLETAYAWFLESAAAKVTS